MTTREQAEQDLRDWAANNARRDDLVRAARLAGVSKNRIHTLTGIARTTINRIVAKEPEHTMDKQTLADQVTATLGDSADDFDVEAIVEEIGDRFGRDKVTGVDDVPDAQYWEIVRKHEH